MKLISLKTLAASVMLAGIAGCTTTGAAPLLAALPCVNDGSIAMSAACRGQDLMRDQANQPAPRKRVAYTETDTFDVQLSSSLGGGLPKVTVDTEGDGLYYEEIAAQTQPRNTSERLVFWLSAVRDTGGTNVPCPVSRLEARSVTDFIIGWGFDQVETWLTYRPVKNYDTLIYFDADDADFPITKVDFVKRTGETPVCEASS